MGPAATLQAVLTFSMDADLRSVFSWNTKQLFVFLQVRALSPVHAGVWCAHYRAGSQQLHARACPHGRPHTCTTRTQAEYATSDAPVNQVVLWDIIIQDKVRAK